MPRTNSRKTTTTKVNIVHFPRAKPEGRSREDSRQARKKLPKDTVPPRLRQASLLLESEPRSRRPDGQGYGGQARLTKTFKEEFVKLNPEQKKAVEHIEGAVLCIAGPGSGKTQVVAMRVANILRKTQVKPGSILCLTFSVSGAKAMRERLREIIGPDAYGISISTVHSFCNDLIGSYPEVFEEWRALEHVSEVEQLHIIRGALEKLPPGSVLAQPKRLYDRAGQILGRIAQMKREDRTPQDLQRSLKLYQAEVGQTKNEERRTNERQLQQFQEFITIYEQYETMLHDSHRYDYEDMVLTVLKVLQRENWLLSSLQERYLYILVDESQDLNRAQYEVVDLLTTSPIADIEPNLFLVGDDDQAIYRFQGATLTNLVAFLKRFPNAEVLPLTKNYRSTQTILNAAAKVIALSKERLVDQLKGKQKIEKKIVAASQHVTLRSPARPSTSSGRRAGRLEGRPHFLKYSSEQAERFGIASELRKLHEKHRIPYPDMAVLCRRNDELHPMLDALTSAGLPIDLGGKQDLLLEPAVRQSILLLKAVLDPNDSAALATALALPCFSIPPSDLGRLWLELRNTNIEREKRGSSSGTFLGLLLRLPTPRSQLPIIATARDLLLDLHQKKILLTLPEVLQRLLNESGLLPNSSTPVHPGTRAKLGTGRSQYTSSPQHLAALIAFYTWVKNRCYEDKTLTLERLLEDIELYSSSATLRLSYDPPHLEEGGVKLMTAHQAKGLEFAAVFIPHFRKGNWGDRRGGSRLALPDHLIFGIPEQLHCHPEEAAGRLEGAGSLGSRCSDHNEEERRLAYVAMTRAKRHLFLSYAEQYQSRDKMLGAEPTTFLAELGETIEEIPTCHAEPVEASLQLKTKNYELETPQDATFNTFLRERLKTFSLSVTALNRFLEDPSAFLWEDLLCIPRAKEPHLAYGSAVHAALEAWGVAMHQKRKFSLDDLLKSFRQAITDREVLTKVQREGFLTMGEENLRRYFGTYGNEKPVVLKTETRITAHLPGPSGPRDIPLTGIIDRIELLEAPTNTVRVVDFKTGRPKTEKQICEDYGGSMYRQLQFYALLTRISPRFAYKAEEFVLDFVGEGEAKPIRRTFAIPYAELQYLEKLIRAVWEKIIALDFTPL